MGAGTIDSESVGKGKKQPGKVLYVIMRVEKKWKISRKLDGHIGVGCTVC